MARVYTEGVYAGPFTKFEGRWTPIHVDLWWSLSDLDVVYMEDLLMCGTWKLKYGPRIHGGCIRGPFYKVLGPPESYTRRSFMIFVQSWCSLYVRSSDVLDMKIEIWPAYTRRAYMRAILQSLKDARLLLMPIFVWSWFSLYVRSTDVRDIKT